MGKAINDRTITAPWWNGPKSPTIIAIHIFIVYVATMLLCSTPILIAIIIKYLFT